MRVRACVRSDLSLARANAHSCWASERTLLLVVWPEFYLSFIRNSQHKKQVSSIHKTPALLYVDRWRDVERRSKRNVQMLITYTHTQREILVHRHRVCVCARVEKPNQSSVATLYMVQCFLLVA